MNTELQKQLADARARVAVIEKQIQEDAENNKPENHFDKFNTLPKIYTELQCDPSKDIIKIDKFNEEEATVLTSIVARMRIAKVYNNGIVPKRGDRRYYPWSYLKTPGPGLVFDHSIYDDAHAYTSSAARLAFLSEEGSKKYFKNFQDVEEGIVQL